MLACLGKIDNFPSTVKPGWRILFSFSSFLKFISFNAGPLWEPAGHTITLTVCCFCTAASEQWPIVSSSSLFTVHRFGRMFSPGWSCWHLGHVDGLRLYSVTVNLIMHVFMLIINLPFYWTLVCFQGDLSPSEHEQRLVLHQQQRAHHDHRVCKCQRVDLASRLWPAVVPDWVHSATVITAWTLFCSVAQKLQNDKAIRSFLRRVDS